jgi:hypothetical protein
VIGFADDLVITVNGNNDKCGLSINLAKTIVIPFTRRSKLNLKNPGVSGVQIEFSKLL